MELQIPFIHRMLAEYPTMHYHVWNLARSRADDRYLRSLKQTGRFKVFNNFHGKPGGAGFNDVYRHYTAPQFKGTLFTKWDDDDVFIETGRFHDFVESIESNPHAVVSANVINHGASTPLNPPLNELFRGMRMPLLDVHLHPRYAEAMHGWFLDNWRDMVGQPVQYVPTKDWCSINAIGYDYKMGRRIAALLDTPSPRIIAQRHFRPHNKVGDEGAVNTLPRIIVKGFTVSHLTFGPQERKSPHIWTDLRNRYAQIGKEYLAL